jgi:formate-dependent nitrite reductase membrane component NrfD
MIGAYLYTGGTAGGAAALAAAAQLVDREGMAGLVRRARLVAAVGCAASGVLLVADLGRPERFMNMLRVVRPSSPMSLGSWILAGASSALTPAAVLAGARGRLGRLGDAAGLAGGALALPLATYTGVLLNNTVIPVWSEPRRSLAPLFAASGASGAACLLDLMSLAEREEGVVRRYGAAAKAAELAAVWAVQREAGRVPRVARPLRRGASGALWRAAAGLTALSLGLELMPGRACRTRRAAVGVIGTLGALATRFAVFRAGFASAADPRATFELQRARGA